MRLRTTHSRPKTSTKDRGYDSRWRRLSERARKAQPFCSDCGVTSDLQADHSPEAWERYGKGLPLRLSDIDVVCGPCNRQRGAARGNSPRTITGRGTCRIHVVIGAPGSGKSTFVRHHRHPGDITIDYDTLANAFAGLEPANHEHTTATKTVTKMARQAAIDAAVALNGDLTVWIIHSTPSKELLDYYIRIGSSVQIVDPGKDVVMRRVKEQRPPRMLPVAGKWYAQLEELRSYLRDSKALGQEDDISGRL